SEQKTARLVAACQQVWSVGAGIASKELLTQLGYASEEDFQRILECHPAKALHDSIANIETAFQLLQSSRLAIIEIYGQFHALVVHESTDKIQLSSTMELATKEVYTFSCAAYSLVQAYRHLKSAAPQHQQGLDQLISDIFAGQPVAAFVIGLR